MVGIKQKTQSTIWIALCIIAYIVLQVVVMGGFVIRYNGVLSAFQYGICLLMIKHNRRGGLKASLILMGMSLVMILMSIFGRNDLSAIPGLFNLIFYIITVAALTFFYRKRENESVTDLLTGSLNRRGLYNTLRDRTEDGKPFSVIYITIDNFKAINDSYGHIYGDELLRKVVRRMKKNLDEDCEIARIGGIEFVVTIPVNKDAETEANKLLDIIREKSVVETGGVQIESYLTCYAGLTKFPEDSRDYEALIQYADIAMLEAMSAKSNTVCVFDKNMAEFLTRQMEVENLIKEGLKKKEFYLMYQPQFSVSEKKLRGFEALIRLKCEDGTMVSPGEFIPVAEKSDLILQIDNYVLRHAMKDFGDIVKNNDDITISVNVSAQNIGSEGFVDEVVDALETTGFPAENLEIEITEYSMVNSMDITIDNICELKKLGIQIALDDFGTGYTSLNYVSKLPVDLLKIDKSLNDDIESGDRGREFVNTVISLGHLMGCEVIAEGVESDNQIVCLREDGCDFIQGFIWSKPLEYEKAKELLAQ